MKKISIQGFPGAFHHIAATNYEGSPVDVVGRHTFDEVIFDVEHNDDIDYGMMAIENSIAGSLLRNYSLIQNAGFSSHDELFYKRWVTKDKDNS